MKLARRVGATSQILQIYLRNTTSLSSPGLTGLTSASAGLVAYYHRDTDTTATQISLVSMTVGTFTSGGFREIDSTNMPGWYQFCPPNAAFATGASSVGINIQGAANMVPLPIEIDLDAQVDVYAVQGQTASAAGAVTFPASIGTSTLTQSQVTGGAYALATNGLGQVTIGATATGAIIAASFGAGAITPTVAPNLDATVSSRLAASSYTSPPTAASIATAVWTDTTSSDFTVSGSPGKFLMSQLAGTLVGTTSVFTAAALANVPSGSGLHSGTCQAGSTPTTIKLDSGASATDNEYQYCTVSLNGGTGTGQSAMILSYVGSTKIATITSTWATTPDNTTQFTISGLGAVIVGQNIAGARTVDQDYLGTDSLKVVDSVTSTPIESATVDFYSASLFQTQGPSAPIVATTTTDALGDWSLSISPGSYAVTFTFGNGQNQVPNLRVT